MKTFRFRKERKRFDLPNPPRPSITTDEAEALFGHINGQEASAPEERLANALRRKGLPFEFRLVVGAAARGLPGWKELDFLVYSRGVLFALEVDSVFTHRNKEQKDKLHDAMILNDPELNRMGTLWPSVLHADQDADLATNEMAQAYAQRTF